ncbi:putative serine hydrolase FSH, alpha/Beta hydrolase [Helianthus annuus]|nr:putative serine hydrolase FSH, alpha/Beta hydrolase [Helianthus annuus]KAJ0562848.1 putative serine hydrolase FSH, alpha/Beta hydrolase [Helianthus annuus]KAJ0730988.1 putative serine hydrolase FSH, alpha/Beta hydrolase [Helianthus annuus]
MLMSLLLKFCSVILYSISLNMESLETPKKPRILCLHGGVSNDTLFKEELSIWPDFVLEKMDLVFINGPFLAYSDGIIVDEHFEWYAKDDETYGNFEEGIAYIEDCMVKLGPFDGVLGKSQRAGISAEKEAPVNFLTDPLEGRSTLRPADILVFGWEGGKHACVDLTGVSPLVGLRDHGFVTGQATTKAEAAKVAKHEKACIENQHVFTPFAFDTFGALAPDAVRFLKRVQQGGIVTGVLPGLQEHSVYLTKVPKIEHVVIISGAKLGGSTFPGPKIVETAFSSPINIPSLHIFGKKFRLINSPKFIK